ncbi:M48 family metallopeptidase [Thalassoglobus sp.]|uniref:M48 family metallopeptidase n=1 Tax=Thalassoglobus sp. TaxID=2795869 RepID=UPI003AA7F7F5
MGKRQNRTLIQEEILSALNVAVPRTPVSLGYRIGLTTVGIAMLLLPLIYLGLIGLISHTVWWNWTHLAAGHSESAFWNVVSIFFGIVTILFLIKPVFSGWGNQEKPVRLKREVEPFLFDYVEAICKAVGAPVPKSIRVNCEPNASAGFRDGLRSLFDRNLTLVIGLPLAAGLNVQQFTGVLAHEFGHFSQSYGMRLSAVIRSINYWFLKAAYDRDGWDNFLTGASQSIDMRLAIFIYAARVFVWLARKLIAFVGIVGHGICSYLLRQMEYDADRYETRMVGTKTFARTCKDLSSIMMAHQMASNDAQEFYAEGRLADNFPQLSISNIPHITPEFKKALHKHERESVTGWFDSHPTNRDRVKSSQADGSEGEFQPPMNFGELPASVLFHDFEKICKAATIRYYKSVLGEDFDKKKVRPTKSLIAKRDAEYEAGKALDRYFQVHIPILRPLSIFENVSVAPENPKQVLENLKASRERMLSLVDEYETLTKCYDEAETTWILAAQAASLQNADLKIKPVDFRLNSKNQNLVRRRVKQAEESVQNLGAKMLEFEGVAEERLSNALQLLQVQQVHNKIERGEDLMWEIRRHAEDSRYVIRMMHKVPDLRLSFSKLRVLCGRLDNRHRPRLFEAIEAQMGSLHSVLKRLQEEMKEQMYPFDHDDDGTTLADYALPILPEPQDLFGIAHVTQETFERLAGVQMRLFSRFAYAAEQVEAAVGLPPLKQRKPAKT